MDRTANKVARSKGHLKTIQTRKKTWDEINRQAVRLGEATAKKKDPRSGTREEDDAVAAFYTDDDDEMGEAGNIADDNPMTALAEPSSEPPSTPASDEEEIV